MAITLSPAIADADANDPNCIIYAIVGSAEGLAVANEPTALAGIFIEGLLDSWKAIKEPHSWRAIRTPHAWIAIQETEGG